MSVGAGHVGSSSAHGRARAWAPLPLEGEGSVLASVVHVRALLATGARARLAQVWHIGLMTTEARVSPSAEPKRSSAPFSVRRLVRDHLPLPSPRVRHLLREAPSQYVGEVLRTHFATEDEHRWPTQTRGGKQLCWETTDEAEPLVTVRIATYNRGPLVVDRAIASALRQTYERLEILVIGDHCDEPTERAVRSVNDPRLRFINLAARGLYPTDPVQRWRVAGTAPMNAALAIAQGAWIAPCDDDDEITDDHVEVLLREARQRGLEFVWSKAKMEVEPGEWVVVGSSPLQWGCITHGSVLYASGLRFLRHNENSWKLGEVGDWNLWRRMQAAGVKMGFVDQVTYRHYLETFQRG